ncbi:hypothetical protein B484DRAFT_407962 [Ochromonadaceae sp. CCMP2298]|nr:hypothetical protein B484DRAFT_407962 [Ochromonadaceae sp. CCMP2298]
MMYHALVAVTLVLCASAAVQQINVDLVSKLNDAIAVSQKSIEHIFDLWDVKTYPNFLKSCTMTKLSWELLKLKFQARILESLEPSEAPAKFVISFTGSSVTAGHDSHFNFSTPVIVGNLMGPAFASMGITLHSRNVALGNNPCTPYDVCVKYFAGVDADIVHWEQTYFCEGQIVEQFIRQSMGMPSKPLVVFSDSNTAKWAKEDCKSGHINRTDPIDAEEQSLLAVDALHLVSEANKQLVSKSLSEAGD